MEIKLKPIKYDTTFGKLPIGSFFKVDHDDINVYLKIRKSRLDNDRSYECNTITLSNGKSQKFNDDETVIHISGKIITKSIIYRDDRYNELTFGSLKPGDLFISNNKLYINLDETLSRDQLRYNALTILDNFSSPANTIWSFDEVNYEEYFHSMRKVYLANSAFMEVDEED